MKSKFIRITKVFVLFSLSIKISRAQTITTVAGIGTGEILPYADSLLSDSVIIDDNLAIGSKLYFPYGLALTSNNNILVGENFSYLLRGVNQKGIIKKIAGTGRRGYSNDGQAALTAEVDFPSAIAQDSQGNIYIADFGNHRIRKIDAQGIITTIAGNGTPGYSGDGGPATSAQINSPSGLAIDSQGNIYFTEYNNHILRKVDPQGNISTAAGTGTSGCSADPGVITTCRFSFPHGVAIDNNGLIYVVDAGNHKIRRVNGSTGTICTVVGTGSLGYSGDGGSANSAQLNWPHGMAFDAAGNMYISDTDNHRIRKVDTNGTITTYAGTGNRGFSGDEGSPLLADIGGPIGIAVDSTGAVYFTDSFNNRIRVIK